MTEAMPWKISQIGSLSPPSNRDTSPFFLPFFFAAGQGREKYFSEFVEQCLVPPPFLPCNCKVVARTHYLLFLLPSRRQREAGGVLSATVEQVTPALSFLRVNYDYRSTQLFPFSLPSQVANCQPPVTEMKDRPPSPCPTKDSFRPSFSAFIAVTTLSSSGVGRRFSLSLPFRPTNEEYLFDFPLSPPFIRSSS